MKTTSAFISIFIQPPSGYIGYLRETSPKNETDKADHNLYNHTTRGKGIVHLPFFLPKKPQMKEGLFMWYRTI